MTFGGKGREKKNEMDEKEKIRLREGGAEIKRGGIEIERNKRVVRGLERERENRNDLLVLSSLACDWRKCKMMS